jgi:hypothetical protein
MAKGSPRNTASVLAYLAPVTDAKVKLPKTDRAGLSGQESVQSSSEYALAGLPRWLWLSFHSRDRLLFLVARRDGCRRFC